MQSARHVVLGIVCLTCWLGRSAESTDWPQFLGPDRNGISPATGLLDDWPAEGITEKWRVAGGVGMSAVAVADGRAVTLVQKEREQRLLVLNAESGATLHEVTLAPQYRNQMGDGPRATPALENGRAYAFTGQGILVAVDLASGRVLWRQDLCERFSAKPAEYGMACSPLLAGSLVVVTVGAPTGCVVACDKQTGEVVWQAGSDRCGYSSPALLRIGQSSQIVAFTGNSVLGISPDKGRLLWRYEYKTDYDCNIATPLLYKGRVFVSSGENHGATLLAIQDGQPEAVWSSVGTGSLMRNEWQTSILVGDHLYGLDNVGSAGPVTHLSCLDLSSGKLLWRETRFGKSNMIAADGKLFFTTLKGELVVVRINPDRYEELGRQPVLGRTRQAPSLAGTSLFVRDDRDIVCLDVAAH